MEFERVIEVLKITLPVFAMIGLGKILTLKGIINEDRKTFINWFVSMFSLPALVFINIAKQKFDNMWNPALVLPSLIAVFVLVVLYMIMAKIFGYKGGFAASWIFGTYWANTVYVGFPMSEFAFGDIGISYAAVYNAYLMLVYICVSFILIGFYGGTNEGNSTIKMVGKILKNPIFLAAIAGTIVAFTAELFRIEQVAENGEISNPIVMNSVALGGLSVIESFLRLVGSMGLPLALIAIGAAMNLKALTNKIFALIMVILGKLVFLPAMAFGLSLYLYPDASLQTLGIGVLLASMPDAVASYVIAKQAGVEEGFVSSMLVLSTGVSIITIPVWLYIIL